MSIVSPPDLSSTDSLRNATTKQLWRSDAPDAIRTAWENGDQKLAWTAWVKHLAVQNRSAAPTEAGSSSLAWAAPVEFSGRMKDKNAAEKSEAHVVEWLGDLAAQGTDQLFALECIAWADRLPELASHVEPTIWWDLCEKLTAIATEAAASQAVEQPTASEALVQQLLAGELPLALSVALPELQPLHEARLPAIDCLTEGLERLTDGEGLLHADLLEATLLLLACWTRCRLRCQTAWPDDANSQFAWLVRQVLRLIDSEGQLPFTDNSLTFGRQELLQTALQLADDDKDRAAAYRRLECCNVDSDAKPPKSSHHSEWAGLTVMAAGWRDKAPRLTVTHAGETMRLELRSNYKTLFSGDWPVAVQLDGKSLTPTDEWDVVCWHTDEDGDYLELSIDLTDGATLERQLLLARTDGVAMLCEVLLTENGKAIPLTVTSSLPLAAGVTFAPEKETRDGWLLANNEPAVGILPLALPEWRVDAQGGSLSQETDSSQEIGSLQLRTESTGRNLASPLWIDFSSKRFAKQRTWRQLTVAEALKKVARDVAVGYRVQSGKKQWIIYRSLDDPANRTLLGHNLSSEALVGRFLKTGEVDEYIEIGDDD